MSGEMLYKVISNHDSLKHKINVQNGAAVKAPKITPKDGEIMFNESSASQVYARYRAISHQVFHFLPYAYFGRSLYVQNFIIMTEQ